MKETLHNIIKEQLLFELPHENMSITIYPYQREIVFAAQQHESVTNRTREFVDLMKENFRVTEVKPLGKGSFKVVFDLRENIDFVAGFIQQMLGHLGAV